MLFRSVLRFSGVVSAALLVGGGGLTTIAHAQNPTHVYDLNGTLADALGGPAITNSLGGVLGASGVTFNANQGLSLSNVLTSPTYSVETQFSLTDTGGYRRLVDFLNRTSDTGLYNLSGSLTFYNGLGTGPAATILPNTSTQLIITRDGATNAFTTYINGIAQFSFIDSGGASLFSGPNNIAYFFVDDLSTPNEASAGFVDYVRTYNTVLTQAEVNNRFANRNVPFVAGAAAPEPGTLVLLGFGALPLAGMAFRRRRSVRTNTVPAVETPAA